MSLESSVQLIDLEASGNEEADTLEMSNDSLTSGETISSEINIKDLTIKLLTSPENLDFALKHQTDKVLDLQGKVSQLLSMSSTCFDSREVRTGDYSKIFSATQNKSSQENSSTQRETTAILRDHYQHVTPTSSLSYHSRSHRRPRSAAYRAKNRQRPRYIQLPPTFKYPEPIDIRPSRGYNPLNNDCKDILLNRTDLRTSTLEQPLQPAPSTFQNAPASNQPPVSGNATEYSQSQTLTVTDFPRATVAVCSENGNSPELAVFHTAPDLLKTQINQQSEENKMFTSGRNYCQTDLNLILSQRAGFNLPLSVMDSTFKTESSAAKSMFELVVGDRKGLNTNPVDQTFWENKGSSIANPAPGDEVPRAPHKRFCPKHAGRGSDFRFQCVCPGSRGARHWGQMKSSPIGARLPTPFLHWKNAIELSRARRCRTKIEPDMLDLLEMKYTESHFVSPYERKSLAEKLGITERAVIYWFQNRRRKDIKNLNNMGQPPHTV
ncbi:hypothetical protein ACHWQZ_G006214 [Mnemiopsis leidyi]